MKVIIRKHLISVFGSMEPGHVHDIPENIAQSWCRDGIAEAVNEAGEVIKIRLEVIPEGMFWCEKHQVLHKEESGPGVKCLKRIAEEEAEAKAKAQTEAEATEEAEREAAEEAEREADEQGEGGGDES